MLSLRNLNKTFFTGLVALLPITATIYLFFWVMAAAESFFGDIIQVVLPAQWYRPGMGVAASLAMIFLVGLMMEFILIKAIADRFEGIIYRMPLVKSIYGSIREFLSFLLEGKSKGPRQVVAVNFGNDITMVGFVTKRNLSFLKTEAVTGKVAVYFPFSYQIGGYTVMVPVDQLIPLDMPMDKAMRFVMTAGIIEKEKSAPQHSKLSGEQPET
ncbi:MAG: DUF502 domain-containing protein [Desulfobulbaceae bacterium]|nr:DUF502 domain-containing protein [Desulfobulbaceae bacterium]HIJ78108.1 DUF502 domain-containing protein [Deltaproteobacteria bacterium]